MRKKKSQLLLVTSIMLFLIGFESGGFQLVLINIAQEFGINNTAMGSLVTVQFIALLIMPLIFGHFSDKIGKKKVLIISVPTFVIGCFITMLSNSVGIFVIGIFVVGAGYGISECLMSAALSDSDPENSGKNLTLSQATFSGGAVAGPLVVNALMNGGFDWRVVFLICGIGFIILFPILLGTRFYERPKETHTSVVKTKISSVLKNKVFLSLAGCMFLYVGLETGLAFFAESFFQNQLNNGQLGAYALSFFWLGMAVSRLIFGMVKAKIVKVLISSFAISAVLLLAISLSGNAWLNIVACVIAGIVYAPVWPMLLGLATGAFPKISGTVSSLMMAASGIGGAVIPALLGFLADVMNFRLSIGALVLLAFAGFVVCMVSLRKHFSVGGKIKTVAVCAEK